jgi:signal transduction histidine kinase
MSEAGSFPRTDALDVIVELISELDERPRPGGRGFYDRLCEGLCRQASMRRAGLMLYDDTRRLVVPVGSHGLDADLLAGVYGSLEETPIAQMALSNDRVVQVSDHLERWVPARYADFAQLTTLTCTPVSAGGRWLGVIFADRGGEPFELNDDERSAMWTIGKTAALAASVRIATNQQGRARLLQARIDLAREIHEGVVQRLFGVSLALGSETGLSDETRRRCADEMQAALSDLRDALERPLAPAAVDTGVTLSGELDRLAGRYKDMPLELDWPAGVEVPPELESLAQSVLAEALRNADKHADPTLVKIKVGNVDGTFVLEVRNDGAVADTRGTGMGLRLAAVEALQCGGVVEFGPEPPGHWRVRLVVHVKDDGG